jgi:hypothetical protein
MEFSQQSLDHYLHEFIEMFWDVVMREAKMLRGDSYELGSLHYERGRYFLSKM